MARPTAKAALVLHPSERIMLTELAASRTTAQREVQRAKAPLAYADGRLPTEIERLHGVSRPTIYKQRIVKGIDEINAHPVRFQWKAFDFEMAKS